MWKKQNSKRWDQSRFLPKEKKKVRVKVTMTFSNTNYFPMHANDKQLLLSLNIVESKVGLKACETQVKYILTMFIVSEFSE